MINPIFPAVGLDGKIRDEHLPTRLNEMVRGVGFSRIVASTDPNTPLVAGDLLLVFEEEKFFFDLSSSGLSKLTPRYTDSTRWSSEDGYVKHAPGEAIRSAMSITDLDALGTYGDVEVVAKVRSPEYTSMLGTTIVARGSGTSEQANVVGLGVNRASMSLGAYVNGSWVTWSRGTTSTPNNEWVWLRLRVQGANLYGRWWADGSPEPTSWEVTATIPASASQLLAPGWVGILGSSDAEQHWAAVGVASDGGAAPVVAS